jgi:hypothetical protein
MLGRGADGLVPRETLMEGAEGREKRVELVVGERCSTDDKDDVERTERRG